MPFGLCNAGATFQRAMQELLQEFDFARNYIDDIMISSETFSEHIQHVEAVLLKLRQVNLKAKPSKCCIADSETKFLGFIVSQDGIKVCPSRSDAISNYPTPNSPKQVRSFLGLASYYRRFIEGFSDIAAPLTALTSKQNKFIWSEECKTSFNELKRRLISPPILQYPDHQKMFCLTTDASNVGLGAVLSQPSDDKENVIAYASRTLSAAERKYTTTELECLAIVWAVERFRPYLYGTVFELVTDHKPLTYLNSSVATSSRLSRWKIRLSEYTYIIRYKPGKDNVNADVLSRVEHACTIDIKESLTNEDLIKLQSEDPRLTATIDKVRKGDKSYKNFRFKEDILYCIRKKDKPYSSEEILRPVVPTVLIYEILKSCHDDLSGAHLGQKKTLHKVASRFFWNNIKRDSTDWVRACKLCAAKKTPILPKAPLHPITEANRPFDMIGIDFVGPLPSTDNGNVYLLVLTDYATRWVEAFATKDSKAKTVARILITQIIARHGAPKKLLSDQGKCFLANIIQEICKYFEIKKINTTAYHPQTNGLTEKFNGTLCKMLSSYCNERQTDWDEYLDICLFAYRTSKQETTKETPFRLLYGRDANLPIDMAKWSTSDMFLQNIEQAWELAKSFIKSAGRKVEAERKPRKPPNYKTGDKVRVESPATPVGLKKKLRNNLWSDPVVILETNETENVLIDTNPAKWVHSNRIKPAEIVLQSGRISRPPERFQAGFE